MSQPAAVDLAKQNYSDEFHRDFLGYDSLQSKLCQRAYSLIGVSALFFLVGLFSRPFLWCAIGFIAVMAYQYFRLRQLVDGLSITRSVQKNEVAKGEKVRLVYVCHNQTEATCPPFTIQDSSPYLDFGLNTISFEHALSPGAKIGLTAIATCEAPSGQMSLGPFQMDVQDELGLFSIQITSWDNNEINVHNAEELKRLESVRRCKESPTMGDLESEKRGVGISLLGAREYVDGDPFSSICWKRSTHGDEFRVKEFEAEISRRVAFVLDMRRDRHLGYGASQSWELSKVFALKMIRSYLEVGSTVSLITNQVQLKDLSGKHNFRLFEKAIEGIALSDDQSDQPADPVNFFDQVASFKSMDPFDLSANYLSAPHLTYIVTPYVSQDEDSFLKKLALLRAKRMYPLVCFPDTASAAFQVRKKFGSFRELFTPLHFDEKDISLKLATQGLDSIWIKATNTTGKLEIVRYES